MKPTRSFRPAVHALEDRTAMSFSFGSVLHSVFPFIPDHSKDAPKPKPGAAQVHATQVHATRLHATRLHATHPHAAAATGQGGQATAPRHPTGIGAAYSPANPRGILAWQGPRLGSPTVRAR